MSDTIAAIATPPGEGGLGVIRISGPEAVAAAGRFFHSRDGQALAEQAPRTLQFGQWMDVATGKVLDEVLCVRFQAPHSFTGEEVVELHAHGGMFHLQSLLKLLLCNGLRLARPGEFTQRAFINGKLDLTRAEAVADLINSGAELSRDAAARQLAGGLFGIVEAMRKALMELSAQVEAAVDFPDEEEQLVPRAELTSKVGALRREMADLLVNAAQGRRVTQGLRVVLVGRPNVGKSSLMNALLGSERSIVTEIAGTTRDYIEERISIQGFPVLLTDTAGLRSSEDPVEQEGVRRSRDRMAGADLLVLVLDASLAPEQEDFSTLDGFQGDKLFVANKCDLKSAWNWGDLQGRFPKTVKHIISLSSKTGEGIEELKAMILESALKGRSAALLDTVMLTQVRHEDAMRRAEEFLGHVELTLQEGNLSVEFLSGDLRGALDALGEIVGKTSREDVINEIFSKFCIGK
jgi:tRNA modification GTPase